MEPMLGEVEVSLYGSYRDKEGCQDVYFGTTCLMTDFE